MSDTDKLIETAAGAVIGALTKAAAEPALALGGRVWAWLKARLTGPNADMATAIEAKPAEVSPRKIAFLLGDLLDTNPAAAAELRALLEAAGGLVAVRQTAIGNLGAVTQISGSGNFVVGGRNVGVSPSSPWPTR